MQPSPPSPAADPNQRFLCHFVREWVDFRVAELHAAAEAAGVSISTAVADLAAFSGGAGGVYLPLVCAEGAAGIARLAQRTVLVKRFVDVWGSGSSLSELQQQLRLRACDRWAPHLAEGVSFKVVVDTFGQHLSEPARVELIHAIGECVPFRGRVRLNAPEETFVLLMDCSGKGSKYVHGERAGNGIADGCGSTSKEVAQGARVGAGLVDGCSGKGSRYAHGERAGDGRAEGCEEALAGCEEALAGCEEALAGCEEARGERAGNGTQNGCHGAGETRGEQAAVGAAGAERAIRGTTASGIGAVAGSSATPGAPVCGAGAARFYFGRQVAAGQRELAARYDLKQRNYIGTTSLDAELALLMANLARIVPGHLVLDPYCGTAGCLVGAAHFGARVIGADLYAPVLRGELRSRSPRSKLLPQEQGIGLTFAQYGLPPPIGLIHADTSRAGCCFQTERSGAPLAPAFDSTGGGASSGIGDGLLPPIGLIADTSRAGCCSQTDRSEGAPSGIGEAAPSGIGGAAPSGIGRAAHFSIGGGAPSGIGGDAPSSIGGGAPSGIGGGAPSGIGASAFGARTCRPLFDAIITDPPYGIRERSAALGDEAFSRRTLTPAQHDAHVPKTVGVDLRAILADLFFLAGRAVVPGGWLVFLLPSMLPLDQALALLPPHPGLRLMSASEQRMGAKWSRWCLAMLRLSDAPGRPSETQIYSPAAKQMGPGPDVPRLPDEARAGFPNGPLTNHVAPDLAMLRSPDVPVHALPDSQPVTSSKDMLGSVLSTLRLADLPDRSSDASPDSSSSPRDRAPPRPILRLPDPPSRFSCTFPDSPRGDAEAELLAPGLAVVRDPDAQLDTATADMLAGEVAPGLRSAIFRSRSERARGAPLAPVLHPALQEKVFRRRMGNDPRYGPAPAPAGHRQS